jgi:phosphoribosylaminoimidazole-succinocarboxamide synthase
MPDTGVHVASGKVRELYELDDERILLVATDRISVFDVVLPTEIPDKGKVLTGLSAYWFGLTRDVVPNHFLAVRPDGRSLECRRLTMLPLECVVRGYLAGSGWMEYLAAGSVCGVELPPGLREAERLETPIFTPTTKAHTGHDEPLDRAGAAALAGADLARELERVSLELYQLAAEHAAARGIILADTKFEFGHDGEGRLVLGDEIFTPDSSRFWPADEYEPGRTPPSFDKQFARDYTDALDWDKTPPGPELPADVVAGTRERYVEAFERLTDVPFARYVDDPETALP